jgi:hypothetical protein
MSFINHLSQSKVFRFAIVFLCLLVILSACSAEANPEKPSVSDTDTETESSTQSTTNNDSSPTASYEALIIQLQQTLLEERENHYISESEYRTRLAQLEAELHALRASLSGSTSQESETTADTTTNTPPKDDIPTGTVPDKGAGQTFSFSYSVQNGTATIREYLGGSTSVAIPSTVDGYPVTAIADNAFKNSAVTSVTIPSSVTDIGWFAFYGCVSLASVTIPDSVSVIHYAAFDACPNLTILCSQNSYAARFVASFGLRCEFI